MIIKKKVLKDKQNLRNGADHQPYTTKASSVRCPKIL